MRQLTFDAVLIVAVAVMLGGLGCAAQPSAPVHRPSGASVDSNGLWLWPSGRDYYPSQAKQRGITGRVRLECSVDEHGYAQNIVILESAGPLLDGAARDLISDQHFRVPRDWSATGGPKKRFRYGFIFQLIGKPDVARFEDNRQVTIITSHGS